MQSIHCQTWSSYWGLLTVDEIGGSRFELHGYENISPAHQGNSRVSFSGNGTLWGFTQEGSVTAQTKELNWDVKPLQWFCLPFKDSAELSLGPRSRVYVMFQPNHQGLSSMGGPIESKGRLRYIDNCTDTVLYSPPLIGDPCLNFLHFPGNVDQKEHFHPSLRSGLVTRGNGVCVSTTETSLEVGHIFHIPAKLRHKFRTTKNSMDVISFHPDSDWGPTHEKHPMINRTWGTNGSDHN